MASGDFRRAESETGWDWDCVASGDLGGSLSGAASGRAVGIIEGGSLGVEGVLEKRGSSRFRISLERV